MVQSSLDHGHQLAALKSAARSLLEKAELAIDDADDVCWRVGKDAWLFWPATGLWRSHDGRAGGSGVRNLIAEIQRRG